MLKKRVCLERSKIIGDRGQVFKTMSGVKNTT